MKRFNAIPNLIYPVVMIKASLLVIAVLWSLPSLAQQDEKDIHGFLDNWHLAAAAADSKEFFGSMTESCTYIGTDAAERWTKKTFETFAKPYFDRGNAWDFKPYSRQVNVTSDGRYAWFSELLTTWMGVCRGSGILVKTPEGWKIEQYHLSVTVPNELIRDFIALIEKSGHKEKK